MEQRITTLEEVSQLLIAASRALSGSVQRLEALAATSERRREEYERQRQEEIRELATAVRRSDDAVQAMLTFVPVTQAGIVRLDSRIDSIEGA
jgi:hypothetical protein